MSVAGKKNNLFVPALVCAVLFVLTSWMWVYNIALVISLPLGLISLMLWNRGRQLNTQDARYKWILYLLAFGSALSLVVLIMLLSSN